MKFYQNKIFVVFGVLLVLGMLVAINSIFGSFRWRFDFTENKAYTLSQGTKNILSKLEEPVSIKYYLSQSDVDLPPVMKNFARKVENLLIEYKKNSHGKITLRKVDPKFDTDEEDEAILDGIQLNAFAGNDFYMGISVRCLDRHIVIPYINPARETLLEYDISRALQKVSREEETLTIGIITRLDVEGKAAEEPWVFYQYLSRDYEIKNLGIKPKKIDDDIDILLLVHPSMITKQTEYAIDQYLLKGGKIVAFLDPHNMSTPYANEKITSSNLIHLLAVWGVTFNSTRALADMTYATRYDRDPHPLMLELPGEAINEDDVVTKNIELLYLPITGVFTIAKQQEGMEMTVLLRSSKNSQTMLMEDVGPSPTPSVAKDFRATDKDYILALRLNGIFKTAFPEGRPEQEGETEEERFFAADPLEVSQARGTVVLLGDADMLNDNALGRKMMVYGQPAIQLANGNLPLLMNIVEQLTGGDDLIQLRSREANQRAYTKIKAIEENIVSKSRDQDKEFGKKIEETLARIREIESLMRGSQAGVLSQARQDELDDLQKTLAQYNKERRQLQKELRKDIDSLITKIKVLNIGVMPLLVFLVGMVVAIVRKRKTSVK